MNADRMTMTSPSMLDALWALPRLLLQGVETLMGRMAQGPPPPGPPPAAMGPGPAPPAFSLPAVLPPRPAPPLPAAPMAAMAVRRDTAGAPAGGLLEPGVKLVQYALVSIRRGAERILPGAGGEVVVTESMTGEAFSNWIVASYLQSPGYRAAAAADPRWAIPPGDARYLRVAWKVLDRWDRESLRFEGKQLVVLDGIRRAILDCCDGLPLPREEMKALPPARSQATALVNAPAAVKAALPAAPAPPDAEAVLNALRALGGDAATAQLVRRTRLSNSKVRRCLRALEEQGEIHREGEGLQTRYHLGRGSRR